MELKEYIKKNGLSNEQFAAQTHVSYPTVLNWVSGKTLPKQKIAERVEKFTGGDITVHDLRGKDTRKKKKTVWDL